MTDDDDFLRTVLAAPADDGPRLVDVAAADVFAWLLAAIEASPLPEPLALRVGAPGASLDAIMRRWPRSPSRARS